MRNIAGLIALVTLATCLLIVGRESVADGNQCGSSSLPVVQNTVWRMEVVADEAAFNGPSVKDRLTYNWNDEAKIRYRWTSTAMPVSVGTSSQLMTMSAAVIGEGVPLLTKGDIVDVYLAVVMDYSKGRTPAILKRVCAAREEGCLNELRRKQEGSVTGVEVKGLYLLAGHRKLSPPLANLGCALQKDGCPGEMAAVLQ